MATKNPENFSLFVSVFLSFPFSAENPFPATVPSPFPATLSLFLLFYRRRERRSSSNPLSLSFSGRKFHEVAMTEAIPLHKFLQRGRRSTMKLALLRNDWNTTFKAQ